MVDFYFRNKPIFKHTNRSFFSTMPLVFGHCTVCTVLFYMRQNVHSFLLIVMF